MLLYLLIGFNELIQVYDRINSLAVSILAAEIIAQEEVLFLLQKSARSLNILLLLF